MKLTAHKSPKLISHRGNYRGRNPDKENHPSYILDAEARGYEVEVDIWSVNKEWFFGHDKPQYHITELNTHQPYTDDTFSFAGPFWFHCKNEEAMQRMAVRHFNAFWHQNDDFVFTQQGQIWTAKLDTIVEYAVVMVINPDDFNKVSNSVYGICCDVLPPVKGRNPCE